MDSTSERSKDQSEKASAGANSPNKMNLLKKKMKVMRQALKDENNARLNIEKELQGAYDRIE